MLIKKIIYLELKEKKLKLGFLKKQKDNYTLKNESYFKLSNFEFLDGKIFNPSKIYLLIQKFLEINRLKPQFLYKLQVIINIEKLINKAPLEQKLITLQTALILSKLELKIKKIISKKLSLEQKNKMTFFKKREIDNQLDFFKTLNAKKTIPYLWLLTSIITSLLTITFLFNFYTKEKIKLNELQLKNMAVSNENKILAEKIKTFHTFKKQNIMLKKIKDKIEKINNPKNILLTISQTIPNNTWLTNLKINPKKNIIELEGKTLNQKEITTFNKKLLSTNEFKNSQIMYVKKIKKQEKNNNKKFVFKIVEKPKNIKI